MIIITSSKLEWFKAADKLFQLHCFIVFDFINFILYNLTTIMYFFS